MKKTRSLLATAVTILSIASAPQGVLGYNNGLPLWCSSPLFFFAPLLLVIGDAKGSSSTDTCSADDGSCKASSFTKTTGTTGKFRCCFSGDSKVEVLGKGLVSMKDLQIMDRVLTGNPHDKFQHVYAFGQRKKLGASKINKLVRIEISATNGTISDHDTATILEVPGEHLIFVEDTEGGESNGKENEKRSWILLRADSLRVGDVVRLGDNHPKYSNGGGKFKKKIVLHGTIDSISGAMAVAGNDDYYYYAPLTKDGTIVVNGIVTSTYATAFTQPSKDSERRMNISNRENHAIHMFLRPLRVICFLLPSLNLGALVPNSTGTHVYVSFGLALAEIYKQGGFIGTIVMILFYLIFGLIEVIESVLFIYIPSFIVVSVSKFFIWFMPTASVAVMSCVDGLDYLLVHVPYSLIVVPSGFILAIGTVIHLIRSRRAK